MNKLFYPTIIFLFILADVYLFLKSSDFRIFGILILYIFLLLRFKLKSNVSFVLSLLFLIFAYFQFLFTDTLIFENPGAVPPASERLAVWSFILIVIGIIQKCIKYGEK